ncbi:MAG: RrF2 family transcriptional regulator [Candidatus Kapaibacteriales bacterium]
MRILFSKQAELGIKAILFLSIQSNERLFNAKTISKELRAPKEFVAKVLQKLTYSDIVTSKKGKKGGFALKKSPKEIKLIDIIKVMDGIESFKRCVLGFENCSDNYPCPVHDEWATLRDKIVDMFSKSSIADFSDITYLKISSFK